MKTATQKATLEAITQKTTRKRKPVVTLVGLAQEFGAPVYRKSTTSGGFRKHVVNTLGEDQYKKLIA